MSWCPELRSVGFHRCVERQLPAAGGRCNRHLKASVPSRRGENHRRQFLQVATRISLTPKARGQSPCRTEVDVFDAASCQPPRSDRAPFGARKRGWGRVWVASSLANQTLLRTINALHADNASKVTEVGSGMGMKSTLTLSTPTRRVFKLFTLANRILNSPPVQTIPVMSNS